MKYTKTLKTKSLRKIFFSFLMTIVVCLSPCGVYAQNTVYKDAETVQVGEAEGAIRMGFIVIDNYNYIDATGE